MTEHDIELTRRKILAGLGTIGLAGAGTGLGTTAYFSDEETYENNSLVAGSLDMKVSWEEHYSDWSEDEADFATMPAAGQEPDLSLSGPAAIRPIELVFSDREGFMDATLQEQFPEGGLGDADPCTALADVPDDLTAPVVELEDVKPGDFGEVTFDFALCDNPGYVWMNGSLISESENGLTEPERKDPDENDTPTANSASLWPLAALAAAPGLRGDDDHEESDEQEERQSTMRKGAAAAGAGVAGLAAASGVAGASGKEPGADPDGPYDVNIDNGTLEVNVGELNSGTGVGGNNWVFQGTGTLYRETYGFRDGTSQTHQNAEDDGSVVSTFPGSVSPGTTASATVEFPNFQTAAGDSAPLEVDRKVTLAPNEATLRVEYDITNTGSATIDDLRISQYVDYDIDDIGSDFGKYFYNTTSECEYIWLKDVDIGLYAGFTGEQPSSNHSLTPYSTGWDEFSTGSPSYNNNDRYPTGSGTDDVELTFEWSLGTLAPGATTTFRNSFVYNDTESDFQTEICEESPGQPEPQPEPTGESELPDVLRARLWYDDGDNVPQADEEVFLEGSLREVLTALSDGIGVPLDGDQGADFDELGGDPTADARGCYAAADAVHNVGFQWWLPVDHGNEVQTDTVTFDLGFYAEQCRHNDGSGMTEPVDLSTGTADWQVVSSPDGTTGPAMEPGPHPNYVTPQCASWIDPYGNSPTASDPSGEYVYELSFTVEGSSPVDTLVIDQYGADNPVELFLDGTSIGGASAPDTFSSLRSDIDPVEDLEPGSHTLSAVVQNNGGPSALLVCATLAVSA